MRRLIVNGLAAAVIIGTPAVGHAIWTATNDGPTVYASQDLGDDLLQAMDQRQVTPRTSPTAAPPPPPPPATAVPSTSGAGTGKGTPPKGGAAPAPAQAPKGGAGPSALPRTGEELPFLGGLTLAATALVGAGFAFRRFRR